MTAPPSLLAEMSDGAFADDSLDAGPSIELVDEGALAQEPIDEESVEDDDEEHQDPSTVCDSASTMIYQLQNCWTGERKEELDALWQHLEAEYQMKLDMGQDALATVLEDFDAPSGEGSNEVDGAKADDIDVDDVAVDESARQLTASREKRRQIEAQLSSTKGQLSHLLVGADRPPLETLPEDDYRLTSLRRDLEQLKLKAEANAVAATPAAADPAEPAPAVQLSSVCTGVGLSSVAEFGALGKWMEELQLLNHEPPQASARNSSPSRKAAGLSKQAMAQIAESRALQWSATQGGKESSPTLACCVGRGPEQLRGESLGDAGYPGGKLDASMHGKVSTPSSATDLASQLDAILAEFDDIDRIHADLCQLTAT